jgi:hypothetical protein
MYQYKGRKSKERNLKGNKNRMIKLIKGFKPDNFLTRKVLEIRRMLMNKLIKEVKNKL